MSAGNPSKLAGQRFLQMLSHDDMAFDNLFCVAFKMLDAQWLAKRASYMEFNVRPNLSCAIVFSHYLYQWLILYIFLYAGSS